MTDKTDKTNEWNSMNTLSLALGSRHFRLCNLHRLLCGLRESSDIVKQGPRWPGMHLSWRQSKDFTWC